jgi:hypothetical protein
MKCCPVASTCERETGRVCWSGSRSWLAAGNPNVGHGNQLQLGKTGGINFVTIVLLHNLDACPLGFKAQIKKSSRWFWAPNHQTEAADFEAKIEKPEATVFEAKPGETVATDFETKPGEIILVVLRSNHCQAIPVILRPNHWQPVAVLLRPKHW